MSEWFCRIDGLVIGPCRPEELRAYHLSGRLSPESLVREGADGSWRAYRERFPVETREPLAQVLSYDGREIKFACPVCRQHFLGEAELLCHRRIVCTDCSHPFQIPGRSELVVTGSPDAAKTAAAIPDGPIRCPHCFRSFSSASMLAISSHPQLVGDPVAGEFEQLRFMPELFSVDGIPLDAMGELAPDRACPHCHLRLPEEFGSRPALLFSIVGAPASGKSYYLTVLAHLLRDDFRRRFERTVLDSDPQLNAPLDSCTNALFLAQDPQQMVMLPKTQPTGEGFSDRVFLNGVAVDLPKPLIYTLSAPSGNAAGQNRRSLQAADLIFYDNAGEHFQPVAAERNNPATRHLGYSDGILFLFDPSGDARWRRECSGKDPQISGKDAKLTDQSVLFSEMIDRVRRHGNRRGDGKLPTTLVVMLGKCDLLFEKEPSLKVTLDDFLCRSREGFSYDLVREKVLALSYATRLWFERFTPSLVAAAENCFAEVIFLPVSSFGTMAVRDSVTNGVGVQPGQLCSSGVELPFLYLLAKLGYLSFAPETAGDAAVEELPGARILNGRIVAAEPEGKLPGGLLSCPDLYAGIAVADPDSAGGRVIRLPGERNA